MHNWRIPLLYEVILMLGFSVMIE